MSVLRPDCSREACFSCVRRTGLPSKDRSALGACLSLTYSTIGAAPAPRHRHEGHHHDLYLYNSVSPNCRSGGRLAFSRCGSDQTVPPVRIFDRPFCDSAFSPCLSFSSRTDTIRCIVASLIEEGNPLFVELSSSDAKLVSDSRDEAENFNDPKWTPDPVDAPPSEHLSSSRTLTRHLTRCSFRLPQVEGSRRDSAPGQHL